MLTQWTLVSLEGGVNSHWRVAGAGVGEAKAHAQ